MPALDIPGGYSTESEFSRPSSSYYECDSVDEVVTRIQTYNRNVRDMIVNSINDLDDSTVINQGTTDMRQPQLAFHSIHGANVQLQKSGRLAKRGESFCKGLVFSNRPIGIDENVCIKMCEVNTNWSGVLRFGVTNIDPETYRNTAVPKFACPDLTSKEGYWAKALPERYSVENNILHFNVTAEGELYYGINGQHKGLFLIGINTTLPLWVIIDIYGNSQAVEFIDQSEHRLRSRSRASSTIPAAPTRPIPSISALPAHESHINGDVSTPGQSNMSFHRVVGRHISLTQGRTVATRSEQEYSHGYVFTERPVANNERITIQVTKVLDIYHGGLAVGLTCTDPSTLRGTELPADSSDLVNFPDMFVGIKDVANKPAVNTKMSFWVTDKGELQMQYADREPRTLIYVDNSLQLYFYFDVYGSTQSIKLLGAHPIAPRSRSPHSASNRLSETMMPTHVALPARPSTSRDSDALTSALGSSLRITSPNGTMTLNVNAAEGRPTLPSRRGAPPVIEDLLTGPTSILTPSSLPPPIAPLGGSSSFTLSSTRTPPPFTPRTSSSASLLQPIPTRTPVPPPINTIPSVPRRPVPPPMTAPPPAPSSMPRLVPSNEQEPVDEDGGGECTVCMNAAINSVIYNCGHMCMCFECAIQTKDLGHGCPICRKPMMDVIRTFKS